MNNVEKKSFINTESLGYKFFRTGFSALVGFASYTLVQFGEALLEQGLNAGGSKMPMPMKLGMKGLSFTSLFESYSAAEDFVDGCAYYLNKLYARGETIRYQVNAVDESSNETVETVDA